MKQLTKLKGETDMSMIILKNFTSSLKIFIEYLQKIDKDILELTILSTNFIRLIFIEKTTQNTYSLKYQEKLYSGPKNKFQSLLTGFIFAEHMYNQWN